MTLDMKKLLCFFPLQVLLSPLGWQPRWPSLTCWRLAMESSAWMTCTEVRHPFVTWDDCVVRKKTYITLTKYSFSLKEEAHFEHFHFHAYSRHEPLLSKSCQHSWSGCVFCWLYKTRGAEGCSESQHQSKWKVDIVRIKCSLCAACWTVKMWSC